MPQHLRIHHGAALAVIAMAALVALTPARAQSSDDLEREALTQIEHELARVQAQVAQAAQVAPSAQRVKFRYDWLQGDLQMMREGITRHLDAPRQPRPIPPLQGDYRQ